MNRGPAPRSGGRRLRAHPAILEPLVDDGGFNGLDRHGRLADAQNARSFTRRRAHTSRELWKIVGRMQAVDRLAPSAAVNQIVPIRNDVAERATLVAEGNPAIHAAGALRAQLVFGHLEIEFAPILQALADRTPRRNLAFDLHEAGNLAHRN